jgi:3-oxoacyl-(acyl-carrier-protein) synthase
MESIEQRGLAQLSATSFARMVLNAPAGACSMHLSLKGPTSTLCTGSGGGLAAVIYAAMLLEAHGTAELMVAGGFDERGPADRDAALGETGDAEGASCLLLGTDNGFESPGGPIFLAGWGLAGPRQLATAVDVALRRAGLLARDVQYVCGHLNSAAREAVSLNGGKRPRWVDPTPVVGWAPASTACQAAAVAVLALRREQAENALVLSSEGDSACSALVLTRGGLPDGS